MSSRQLPTGCPSCERPLKVKRFECGECGTTVDGAFDLPVLARLQGEEQAFVLNFIATGGSLKELARLYSVSYPTVRNRLDALRDRIKLLNSTEPDDDKEN